MEKLAQRFQQIHYSHKEIELKVVLNESQTLLKAFYDWFYKKVAKLYSKELEEFIRLDREIGRLSRDS